MNKKYDLEERTLNFSKECINLCKIIPKDIINTQLIVQFLRSSASVGANYREANNALTKKDFYHRISVCRKESKESMYWLELLAHQNKDVIGKISFLCDEALQLARIFSSIGNVNR